MSKPLITVIVPVYKVEKYLEKCVKSILNQTYENLEIILVDDGSPDNCGNMCDELAKQDSRIRVIHKSNGGLSSARNAGLDVMTGEYVGFVDSDDYIDAASVPKILSWIDREEADICFLIRACSDKIHACQPHVSQFCGHGRFSFLFDFITNETELGFPSVSFFLSFFLLLAVF